jgi:hypothetical protein
MISMMGGEIRANVELLTAPTNEITAPKFGIIAARATAGKKSNILSYYNLFC